ncbi:unnamed protein product [Cladocopium goreaui]|uniref:Pectin acetylesterase n=1 Tax=Cladocopium goreaui TaxID=2562237 RepID=A0A9P1BRL3_9DINO|nr:unnamed protein product [Cladocopium goreaui]
MSFCCSTAWKCTGAWPTRAAERFRRWCFFLVAAAHGWSCNDAGATAMLQRENLTDVDPLALCNDGSPAMFYMQENISSSEWVVYLAGGGWCYDLESCQGRFDGSLFPRQPCDSSNESVPCWMSSKDYPEICGKTGIFDAHRSPFRAANLVYVPYCTSDAYMGDGVFGPWQFRGARVVRAVFTKLAGRLQGASRLIFGGGSAGGRGSMVLLDEVSDRFPRLLVRGFLDSPYYLDVPSFSPKFAGFQPQHSQGLPGVSAHGRGAWSRSLVAELGCGAIGRRSGGVDEFQCLLGGLRQMSKKVFRRAVEVPLWTASDATSQDATSDGGGAVRLVATLPFGPWLRWPRRKA